MSSVALTEIQNGTNGKKLAAVWKVRDFIFKFELEELLMRLTGSGFL